MARHLINLIFILFFCCTKDKGIQSGITNYPDEIASIIIKNCATAGCHNQKSKAAAGGLSLDNWNSLFEGARSGPVVIPYRADFSTFCYYTNTFAEFGPSLTPTMPIGREPLSKNEFLILQNWIKDGAPRKDGYKFYTATKSKFYATNQLCDVVSVVDADTKHSIRYINVGVSSKNEFPVCVKVAPNKQWWYTTFLASTVLQKFDTQEDQLRAQVDLGPGVWTSFSITEDSRYAFCVDLSLNGKVAVVDLETMTVKSVIQSPHFVYPRGIAINNQKKKFYVGAENGNYINSVDYSNLEHPKIKQIILDGSKELILQSVNDPKHLLFDESSEKLFVSCAASQEIKTIDSTMDSLTSSIALGTNPGFLAISSEKKLLFTACNSDTVSYVGNIGSLKLIDIKTNKLVKTINPGFQPNGLSIFKRGNYIAVLNSNTNPKGPAPHHTSACSGRNGYMTFVDLNNLEIIPSAKFELAVYPYAIDVKE